MRIQETDRILKEARDARHDVRVRERDEHGGMISRVWKSISALPGRMARGRRE